MEITQVSDVSDAVFNFSEFLNKESMAPPADLTAEPNPPDDSTTTETMPYNSSVPIMHLQELNCSAEHVASGASGPASQVFYMAAKKADCLPPGG
ncbi:hypothetical protein BWQ96_04013 [Gracilariopsis chorda]|uniref:Uncharacterized protein n=1 Tax=Gracilariopsis chorda TaxID=448386 RepID=A0A2V3IVQ5_9FLOR|nr:hypothetical protein BWQ96_04013 [Gracilariopsis chorda]|eukprot:PXF46228.1 hypothetical protein BWQ96_04013 [Gracilariopsis chorda]